MPILETLVAVTGLSAARRLFDKAVDHFFPDKTKSNKAAQPPAPRPVQQEVVYLAQQAQREQAWLVLQKEASEIRKVEVDANFRIAAAEAKRAEYALHLSEQTLAVRRQELALMAEQLRHDQALAETQRKALEATLKLRAKELQLLEQGLAAKQELGRQYLELLRQKEAQAIELKQQELQAQWDEQKWAGLLSRQEMHTILRGQEQRHRLLLIIAQPAISQDVPPTIRENLPLELPSELKAFVEEHYPTGDPLCPVQFFGKFFEKPIFDTEVKKLEALLAPLPAAILYSNITDDKVFLHLSFSGGNEGGDEPLTETLAWNWEEQQAALVKAGQTERAALRQVRRAIVEMHQFLAAFLTDLYYLSVNPLHEPRLYRLESAPTMTWQHDLLEQLRTVQEARSTTYWAEVERVRAAEEAAQQQQIAEIARQQAAQQLAQAERNRQENAKKFQNMRAQLLDLMTQMEHLVQQLKMVDEQHTLQQLQQNLQNDNIKLLVISEFGRGTRTLIKALFVQNVVQIRDPGFELITDLEGLDGAIANYLDQTDALLFVIACDFPVSTRELDTLRNEIQAGGFKDIFFVCNGINRVDEDERESIKARCRKLLAPFTLQGEQHIFFVDARAALKAREQNNLVQLQASGLLELETALANFLTTEKGRVKLSRPIHQMKSLIERVYTEIIPDRKALLTAELEQVEKSFSKVQKELAALENQQAQILQQLESTRLTVKLAVQERARRLYQQAAEATPDWVKSYIIVQKGLGFRDAFAFKTAVERVLAEMTEYLTNKVKAAATDWQKVELTPLLTRSVTELQNSLEPKLQRFVQQVDEVRMEGTNMKVSVQEREISTWERILAGTAGMLIDPGSAAMGTTFGFRGMRLSIIPQTSAIIIGLVITGGALSPVLLVPLLTSRIVSSGFRPYSTEERIKQKIGEEYEKQLRDNRDDLAKKVADGVDETLAGVQSALKLGLTREIDTLRTQAESVIQLKKEEQAKVEEARRTLEAAHQQASKLEKALDELLGEMAVGL